MRDREARAPAQSSAQRAEEREQERPDDAARERAPRESVSARGNSAQKSARDDAERVHERRERGERVSIARLQRCRQQSSDDVEQLRRQHDARQRDELRLLFGGEPRRDERRQRRQREPQHDRDRAEQHAQEVRDDAERYGCALLLAAREVRAEDRDEHDRQRAAREQVVEEVGDDERGRVEIALRARASVRPSTPSRTRPITRESRMQPPQIRLAIAMRRACGTDGAAAGGDRTAEDDTSGGSHLQPRVQEASIAHAALALTAERSMIGHRWTREACSRRW
jgi:hypothetical protein